MPNEPFHTGDPLAELRAAIVDSAREVHAGDEPDLAFTVERPPRPELGDYSTNVAMLLAPAAGGQPRELAVRLREPLTVRLGDKLERVDIAGPGFVNLFLADGWYRDSVAAILAAGDRFGSASRREAATAVVEFVSANPTGPLTAAGGRHAAYGDSLSRILDRAGYDVERDYYVNDTGGQIRRFAESIAARMTGAEAPADGYAGEYVAGVAEQMRDAGLDASDLDRLAERAVEAMLEQIRATLERFGVIYDVWFSERSVHDSGALEQTIEELRGAGHVYESEGATWLRTSELGDDKDRVLIRSGGEPTYFAADIAYHRTKLARARHLLDVLGADHHGYVPRMRAAIEALGADPRRLEPVIMQLVHVVERGERAQMSKRKGEFVTLDDLIDDIGVDAARFFMVQRSHDTTIDLDLDLARRQSADNPVYYVQYAHARIASILRRAREESGTELGPKQALDAARSARDAPTEPAERALIRRLLDLPQEVAAAAALRAPHRLCAYATSVAADFHGFYRDCHVVGSSPATLERGRLALCHATRSVIATTLGLLGVSAPDRM